MTHLSASFAEPPLEEFPYAGWIPTANGRLSFRHIGEAQHPTESIYSNLTTADCRFILGYQRRPLSDVLFQRVIHYLCNIEGSFWFVIAASSTDNPILANEIVGNIYIYKSKRDWRNRGERSTRSAIYQLNDLRLSLDPDRDQKAKEIFASASVALDESSDIIVAYRLTRTGEIYFTKPRFQDSELEYASIDYAQQCGHDFPRWVADQAYFFFRDIAHRHQHHSPSSDTILILQDRTSDNSSWRDHVIYSLHYSIIRAKRFADVKTLYQAAGVLAYCESFTRISERYLKEDKGRLPAFNSAELAQSLEARAQEELVKFNRWSTAATLKVARAGARRAMALAFVAITIAVLAIFVQPLIPDGAPQLKGVAKFAATHFMPICAGLLIIVVAVWIFTHSEWHVRYARDVLEVANVRRLKSVVALFLLAAAVLGITIWIAQEAIEDVRKMLTELLLSIRR